jgi:hypothetical protein
LQQHCRRHHPRRCPQGGFCGGCGVVGSAAGVGWWVLRRGQSWPVAVGAEPAVARALLPEQRFSCPRAPLPTQGPPARPNESCGPRERRRFTASLPAALWPADRRLRAAAKSAGQASQVRVLSRGLDQAKSRRELPALRSPEGRQEAEGSPAVTGLRLRLGSAAAAPKRERRVGARGSTLTGGRDLGRLDWRSRPSASLSTFGRVGCWAGSFVCVRGAL